MNNLIVIGGGPAGMTAAFAAGKRGIATTLLEKNEKLGKKLFITGKGRCNITNMTDISEFFPHMVKNPKFLMSSLYGFSNSDLLTLLNEYGLKTKIERGNRVFPVSDKSNDVIKTLRYMLDDAGVTVQCSTVVAEITKDGDTFVVKTSNGTFTAGALVIATGGLSYPLTGSTGDGYLWAERLGHSIVQTAPALVALEDQYNICAKMQGLTLKNINFTLMQGEKKIYAEQGELLFTHFGISGPVVLSASSYIDHRLDLTDLHAVIDLKPALSEEKLDARLIREFEANHNKQLKNYMCELMPSKLIHPFLQEIRLDGNKQISQINKEERTLLLQGLKGFAIKIADTRPIEEAVITAGGIGTKEINPSTMESKIVQNLYFAGEVIDVSALTGGFNLQIAFSTGYLAGSNVYN